MAIGDDYTVSLGGDIRHVSGGTVYPVLSLHQWLQDMADDANVSASGDNVSILSPNPSKLDGPRSSLKPMTLNLLNGYNIDDTAAQFLNFGSVQQDGTNTLRTGAKTIGSPLVAGSPMYVVQNGAKLNKYWPDGHIQIMVKAKEGGVLIDNGDIRVYSRKYGQTYGDFAANLLAGGEQPAAISTAVTDWTPLPLATALALSAKVTVTPGDVSHDTGDGSGNKLYKGTIALTGGCSVAEAAQYCQSMCDQDSVVSINGDLGWKYRTLDTAYTPNGAAPFGLVAGGKWFVEQGWLVTGVADSDHQKYQMISHDGTKVTSPVVSGITIGGLEVGAYVMVGRDNGAGGFLTTEYTLNGATTALGNTCVITEAIKPDTPATGFLRVNGVPYLYTGFVAATKTFTISGTWGQIHASASPAWVPFIDKVAAATSESSANYTYSADFVARLKARRGAEPDARKPFETTFSAASSATNGTNAILDSDE